MSLPFNIVRNALRLSKHTLVIFDADPAALRAYKEQFSNLGFDVKAILVAPAALEPLRMPDGTINPDRLEGMIRQAERAESIAQQVTFADRNEQNLLFAIKHPQDTPTTPEEQRAVHARAIEQVLAREAGNAIYMKQVREEGSRYPIDEIVCTREQVRECLKRHQPAGVLADSNMRNTLIGSGEVVMSEAQSVLGRRSAKVMHTNHMKDNEPKQHIIFDPNGHRTVPATTWRDRVDEAKENYLIVPKANFSDRKPPAFEALEQSLKRDKPRSWGEEGPCPGVRGAL
jgi:hypothetical protein